MTIPVEADQDGPRAVGGPGHCGHADPRRDAGAGDLQPAAVPTPRPGRPGPGRAVFVDISPVNEYHCIRIYYQHNLKQQAYYSF